MTIVETMSDEREPLPYLLRRLATPLRALTGLPPSADPRDILREARYRLGDGRRAGSAGGARLGVALLERRRQRRIFELVDYVVRETLADEELTRPFRSRLRRELETLIDGLPPRYRNVLRLRYGLDMTTEELSVRLGTRKASVHKPTLNGLALLARALLARGPDPATSPTD